MMFEEHSSRNKFVGFYFHYNLFSEKLVQMMLRAIAFYVSKLNQ